MSKQPQQHVRYQKVPTSSKRSSGASRRLYWIVGGAAVAALIGASFLIGGRSTSSGSSASGATVGSIAPAFSGVDVISGREITSKSLAGENVLYFFNEGIGCQACMVQIQALQQHLAHLNRDHLTLISVTNDEGTMLAQAASGYRITVPLVADPSRTLTQRFGALGGGPSGGGMHADTADHTFILVDKAGRVRFHKDYPNMWVDPNALLEQLPKVA